MARDSYVLTTWHPEGVEDFGPQPDPDDLERLRAQVAVA